MNDSDGHTTRLRWMLDDLAHGNTAARDEIIAHVCDRLRGLTRKMLRDDVKVRRWEQTDDVLQNALLRLHRSLAQVRPTSAEQFYGLAATQIRRELIDLARHHFGPRGVSAKHQTDHSIGDRRSLHDYPGHVSEPQDIDAWTRFHEEVERLPHDERRAFDLLWYEGMSQPEAAQILDVSLKTVKRRWQSAKILLRERLAECDVPEAKETP
jgi:RNA polymerase sigma factor (sigma-70 family)